MRYFAAWLLGVPVSLIALWFIVAPGTATAPPARTCPVSVPRVAAASSPLLCGNEFAGININNRARTVRKGAQPRSQTFRFKTAKHSLPSEPRVCGSAVFLSIVYRRYSSTDAAQAGLVSLEMVEFFAEVAS